MSSLSLVEAKLPAGFRFHPRDDELICDYLMKWVSIGGGGGGAPARHGQPPPLIEVDLNKCEPWDIPAKACVGGKDWYFYSQRDKKYATGLRTNRATVSGYWKATGKDTRVLRKGTLVGMRKTLVFYEGRAPKGRKTSWVMHEFRLEGPLTPPESTSNSIVVDWVICKVFNKNKTEVCAKNGLGSNIYHETITTNSWSLQPLMEPYNNINTRLDQIDHDQNERVSSFSINCTPNPNISSIISHVDDHDLSNIFPNPLGGQINSKLYNPSDYYDKKAVTHVLKHVCTSGSGSASFGEGSTAESYLSHEISFNQPYSIWN